MPGLTKRHGAVALAILVAVGAGSAFVGRSRLPVAAIAAQADRGPVVATVSGIGTVESQTEVPLGFEAAGRIASLNVQEGDRVQAGQVLGSLDLTDLQQQLAVAEANHAVASAAIARSLADRERALATRERAAQDHDRKAALAVEGAISLAERDAVAERLAVSRAEVQAVEASLAQARKSQAASQRLIAVQQAAMAHGRLLSPIDGLVVRRHREPGQVITPGSPVLTVASTQKLWARTWIDESALGSIRPGQPAEIRFHAQPDKAYPGRVDRVGQQVDRQTHELLVDVTILGRPPQLALGQRAEVAITTASRPGVVRVPRTFLDTRTGTVIALRDGLTAPVTVQPGLVGTTHVEIRSGLRAGETVVRSPQAGKLLPAGRPVKTEAAP